MLAWPHHKTEETSASGFQPPHCPWPECSQHEQADPQRFGPDRAGFYTRRCDGKRIQRYRCRSCGRTFSQQSFACSYYLKRPELLVPIAAGLNAGSAHRQLARSLGCAPSTVTRQSQRLGRHAMLLHAQAMASLPQLPEPIVLDHFETFAYSQWDRLAVATPVGQDSWFVYGLAPAVHRRAGRVSVHQRRRRERRAVPRPPLGQYLRSMHVTLNRLAARLPAQGRLPLITDGLEAYQQALCEHPSAHRFWHRSHPNPARGSKGAPRSPEARERDQQMFAVDVLHGLWRHSSANHRRETIAFARRANAVMERGYLFAVWRNFVKARTERHAKRGTPAMRIGLADTPWSWERVLARRIFWRRVPRDPDLMALYRRELVTPALGQNARHTLKNAF